MLNTDSDGRLGLNPRPRICEAEIIITKLTLLESQSRSSMKRKLCTLKCCGKINVPSLQMYFDFVLKMYFTCMVMKHSFNRLSPINLQSSSLRVTSNNLDISEAGGNYLSL